MATAALVAVGVCGCATEIAAPRAAAPSPQREALVAAAKATQPTAWPQTVKASFVERLSGVYGADAERFTKSDAVEAYLIDLRADGEALTRLTADAGAQLRAAGALAEAGDAVRDSVNLRMSDVAVLEDAILALRDSRSIYLETLKHLDDDVDEAAATAIKATRRHLRDAFNVAIARLGAVADDLADRVMHDATQTLARPASPLAAM